MATTDASKKQGLTRRAFVKQAAVLAGLAATAALGLAGVGRTKEPAAEPAARRVGAETPKTLRRHPNREA